MPRARSKSLAARLRRMLLDNIWLKLISLLMAFTLWYIVTGGPQREETIGVRLSLERFLPEGWALAGSHIDRVDLRLRGRYEEIGRLMEPEAANRLVSINLDRSQIQRREGVQRIRLDASNLSLPFGVEVLELSPNAIPLQLDEEVTRRNIEVRLQVSGAPLDCYRVAGEPAVEPQRVDVTGARRLVELLQFVTADVSYEGRAPADRIAVVPINREPLLRYSHRTVEATLDIVERDDEERTFAIGAPNFVYGNGGQSVEISIDPAEPRITILGPCAWVRSLQAGEITIRLSEESVRIDGGRALIEFAPEMVVFERPPPRPEAVTVSANPGRFHVVVRQANGG